MQLRKLSYVASYLLFAASCTDIGAPDSAGRRYVGRPPSRNSMSVNTDWYSCASWDGGQTWNCEYDHTEYGSGSGTPDYWDYRNVLHTTALCSTAARYCDSNFQPGGGSSPYTDPREIARADEVDDIVFPLPTCPANKDDHVILQAYCAGHIPTTTQLDRIRAALTRIHQKGGICDSLASIGDSLLAHNTLRVFPQAAYGIGGGAPLNGGWDGPNSWAVISEDLTNKMYDSSHAGWAVNRPTGLSYKSTLQSSLAHELDHLNGERHILENGIENMVLTPNNKRCADVDMGDGIVRPR